MKLLVLCALFGAVFAHTWMSCPWSFDVDPGRPADTGLHHMIFRNLKSNANVKHKNVTHFRRSGKISTLFYS